MKLKFKNQDFQTDAVNAVVDLFAGQEKTRGTFSVETENQTNLLYNAGGGNALVIDDEALEANMHAVQKRNKRPLTEADWRASRLPLKLPARLGPRTTPQFCIEM